MVLQLVLQGALTHIAYSQTTTMQKTAQPDLKLHTFFSTMLDHMAEALNAYSRNDMQNWNRQQNC